jgi:hypothetical protein
MEDGRKILFYISLQAREATYSCSGSPVTGTCQPSTNALHQDHNKVFLFITPSTGDGLRLIDAPRLVLVGSLLPNLSQRSQWQLVLLKELAKLGAGH